MNGLSRQFLPRGIDVYEVDASHLDDVADGLSQRPRETLDWRSPAKASAATVATAD